MANNTLTQRMSWPGCEGSITVDASDIKDGDYAGICALQGCYGMIAITREKDQYYLVMKGKEAKDSSIFGEKYDASEGTEYAKIPMDFCKARLKVVAEFMNQKDEASFYYERDGQWIPLGIVQKLYFKMDHFTGCRFGLFYYATREVGGRARFQEFVYEVAKEE